MGFELIPSDVSLIESSKNYNFVNLKEETRIVLHLIL